MDGRIVWLMADVFGDVTALPPAPPWFADAACLATELDFVEPGGKTAIAACLALCSRCPVRDDCYRLAIDEGHVYGIFGGTTAKQRQQVRQEAA